MIFSSIFLTVTPRIHDPKRGLNMSIPEYLTFALVAFAVALMAASIVS